MSSLNPSIVYKKILAYGIHIEVVLSCEPTSVSGRMKREMHSTFMQIHSLCRLLVMLLQFG